jgi:hypothetical protein
MVIKMEMESDPIEEPPEAIEEPPEAIIPMEIVGSGDKSAIEEAEPEAIIPNETLSSGTGTGRLRRKVARRTESWYPQPLPPPQRSTRERQLPTYVASSPPPPQAEDIPARARKKRRLKEPLPTPKAKTRARTTDEAARKTALPDLSVGLPPDTTDDGDIDDGDADVDPVTDTQPNAEATARWTLEEDARLTRGVTNAPKKKHHGEYKKDWVAISALIPGRTRNQCGNRWRDVLDPSIDRATGRNVKWTEDEGSKLKDAVQTYGGKDWGAISALVPGRTKKQCRNRWHNGLDQSIDRADGRTCKWTTGEDTKLEDAVQTHGGKNWIAISALVPGRTRSQCSHRWKKVLDPSIDRASGRDGKWTAIEDSQLQDAVQTHGGKNWAAIAALVPGRTTSQCWSRWKNVLDPSIDRATGRNVKWTADEDSKLKDAVRTYGGKNWCLIAALVPGRTRNQCTKRWHAILRRGPKKE